MISIKIECKSNREKQERKQGSGNRATPFLVSSVLSLQRFCFKTRKRNPPFFSVSIHLDESDTILGRLRQTLNALVKYASVLLNPLLTLIVVFKSKPDGNTGTHGVDELFTTLLLRSLCFVLFLFFPFFVFSME